MILKKSLTTLYLLALLLVLCADSLEARRRYKNRSHSHCNRSRRDTRLRIEIFHPKGLMVWYPQRPGMTMFGIEIFLNKQHQQPTAQDNDEEQPACDICLNTTEVSYGKFILRDDDAIIRGGDHLMYNIIKQKVNGSVYMSRSNDFYVAESRITPLRSQCSRNTPSSSTPSNETKSVAMLEDQIIVLENVVYDVFQQCQNVSATSRNLFLNVRPASDTRMSSKDLYEHTKGLLEKLLPQLDWNVVLTNAYYYDDGVAFEARTMIDKLKILQMSKNFVQYTIRDLDEVGMVDDENDVYVYDIED